MISRHKLVFSVILLFVVSSASVFAGTFEFMDTTSEVPGSTFTLSIMNTGGDDYTATLMVDTFNQQSLTSEDWYINYVTLHLDGGQSPSVNNLMFNGATPVNWDLVPGGTDVGLLKRKHFPQNSWVGLHTFGIADGSEDINEGVLLDGGSATWFFDFTLASGSILNPSPSIQVGYFNYSEKGKNGKIFFTQMSQTAVPEPSTLILLLSGTGILAGAARFRRKMK